MKCSNLLPGAAALLACMTTLVLQAQRISTISRRTIPDSLKTSPAGSRLYWLPIIYDTASGLDTAALPLRPAHAFGPTNQANQTPLPYPPLRFDDALYAQKIWREIDFSEKMNQSFRYEDGTGPGRLFARLMLDAVLSGQVMAFDDDRFSQPIAVPDLKRRLAGPRDTVARINPATNAPDAWIVTDAAMDMRAISRLRIMEEWVVDRNTSRLQSRIIGLAPVIVAKRNRPGGKEEVTTNVLCWVYYPDIRPVMAGAMVYNPKNMGNAQMSWDELFSARMFGSTIIKTNLDNAGNRSLRSLYKDPIQALLEGERIGNKLSDHEQDLWSY